MHCHKLIFKNFLKAELQLTRNVRNFGSFKQTNRFKIFNSKKQISLFINNNGRNFSISQKVNLRVTILGSGGEIGQPLSLLLKYSPDISVLHLYDISKVNCGVATDLSHIETLSCIAGFTGCEQLPNAIRGSDIVLCCAGQCRKPGMSRDDLFKVNASIIKTLSDCCAKCAPDAYFLLITNPINSLLPLAGQIYKMNCVRTDRIFGITTLDVCRANKFMADIKCLDPADVNVPVICGHSCPTIVPVLSQATPCVNWCCDERYRLACRIQQAGTEVLKTRGKSATLSVAYSAARLTFSLIRAMKGECIVECLMCQSCACPQVEWFAGPVQLGKCGIEKHLGIPPLDECERSLLTKGLLQLMCDIDRGYKYACAICKC